MGRIKRLGKNTLLISVGTVGSKLINFIMLPLYTRWLTVDEFGLADLVVSYSGLLLSFVTFAITESIFIFPKNESEKTKKSLFSIGLFFLIFSSLFFIILSWGLEEFSHANRIRNSFVDNISITCILVVSTAFQSYTQQFARSNDSLMVYSLTGIVHTALIAFLGWLLIPQYKVSGYFLSMIYANCGATLFSFYFSNSYKYISFFETKIVDLKRMLLYSIPLIPNTIMWWLIGALNRPIMEKYVGLEGIGLYAVANKFPALLTMIFTMFASAWQISVLEEYGKDDYKIFYNQTLKIVFTLMSLGVVAISWCSKPIIHLFATHGYYDAWQYIPLLTLAVFFSSISTVVGSNFSATKESKYFFYSSIWGGGVTVAANLLLIPVWGTIGAVFSTLFSFFVMAIVRILYSWKYVKIMNIGQYFFIFLMLLLICVLFTFEFKIYLRVVVSSVFLITLLYTNHSAMKEVKLRITQLFRNKISQK